MLTRTFKTGLGNPTAALVYCHPPLQSEPCTDYLHIPLIHKQHCGRSPLQYSCQGIVNANLGLGGLRVSKYLT